MPKRDVQRVMITMDKRLVIACDKFIEVIQQRGISNITTKSQLIEQALLCYFDTLNQQVTTKEENEHES